MSEVVALKGPVELVNGEFVLRIPLAAGGAALAESARGISEIEGDSLNVTVPGWLAEKLEIRDGSIVLVDNKNGKFNIIRAPEEQQELG